MTLKEEILSYLNSNSELNKLITSIEYSDDSLFNIILCDNKSLLDDILSFIQDRLFELVSINYVYKMMFDETNILEKDFYTNIENLFYKDKKDLKNSIVIFNLNFLENKYIFKIEEIFHKLNNFRNRFMQLNIPLILIIPQDFKTNFMSKATDFWSIKSVVVDVDFNNINIEVKNKYIEKENNIVTDINSLNNMYLNLKNINNKNIEENRLLMYICDEIANIKLHKYDSNLFEILKLYKEAYKIAQDIQNLRPDSIEAKRDVSVSLNKLADIYIQKGEVSKALDNYTKSLEIAQDIQNLRPDSIEAKRDLCISYIKLANIPNEKNDIKYLNKAKIISFDNINSLDFKDIYNYVNNELKNKEN